jgi:hypothetical protein
MEERDERVVGGPAAIEEEVMGEQSEELVRDVYEAFCAW